MLMAKTREAQMVNALDRIFQRTTDRTLNCSQRDSGGLSGLLRIDASRLSSVGPSCPSSSVPIFISARCPRPTLSNDVRSFVAEREKSL